jgi:hypothetical protein
VRRRTFITLLGSAPFLLPLPASAQEPGRVYRIGGLHSSPHDAPHHKAMLEELQRLGFVEGQNLAID